VIYLEYVIKRDGSQVTYNKDKIFDAIYAANAECEERNESYLSLSSIYDAIEDIDTRCHAHESDINVEEIQNIVERVLMSYEPDVARAYIRYRYMKEVAREYKADFFEAIGDKLAAKNVANQNANVDEHSFGGRVGEASDAMMKEYALNFCMSKMARENHLNNQIYIHDLSAYAVGSHNCLTVPFDHLLEKGFNTRQVDIRPANSVDTAFQLVAVIFQLQSLMQFGGVSASHIDWTMVPYVRKSFAKHFLDGVKYFSNNGVLYEKEELYETPIDSSLYQEQPNAYKYAMDMLKKELSQAAEGLYHNLNSLQSRSGNQLPFTSLNYGTCTLPEGRMVIKALLEGSIKGVGKHHRTPIFPCGIFQVGEGINKHKGDPNYDLFQLALKSTSLRLYPNYANIDWSGNAGYDRNDPKTYFSTMGKCKLQLM
jgi:ribonucleoside-triphosphate reductase